MANKRKPDNVHQLQGTLRKDRHGDPNTKVTINSKIPAAPGWLTAKAKTEWKRIVNVMQHVNVLTAADLSTLAQYCILYAELTKWKEDFPAAKHTQLRMCAAELGLTPSARSKITVVKTKPEGFDDI